MRYSQDMWGWGISLSSACEGRMVKYSIRPSCSPNRQRFPYYRFSGWICGCQLLEQGCTIGRDRDEMRYRARYSHKVTELTEIRRISLPAYVGEVNLYLHTRVWKDEKSFVSNKSKHESLFDFSSSFNTFELIRWFIYYFQANIRW